MRRVSFLMEQDAFRHNQCCLSSPRAVAEQHSMAGVSLDSALKTYDLNAIVAPTDSPGWTTDLLFSDHFLSASSGLAGPPGYPIINVPAGVASITASFYIYTLGPLPLSGGPTPCRPIAAIPSPSMVQDCHG